MTGVEGAASFRLEPRDGVETFANPGVGRFGSTWIALKESGNTPYLNFNGHRNFCLMWNLGAFSAGNAYRDQPAPTTRVGGKDLPLTRDALDAIKRSLDAARADGVTLVVRVAYTDDAVYGAEPSDFAFVLRHQKQIGAILAQYPDVVAAIECGMIGPWGEMHSSTYDTHEQNGAVVRGWLAETAPSTAILVRAPKHLLAAADVETTAAFLAPRAPIVGEERLGMYNDGYLGTDWDYGTWPGGEGSFTRAQGVAWLATRRTPYGGECAYISTADAEKVTLLKPDRYNVVEEFYRTHLSYLRNITQKISLVEFLDSLRFDARVYAFEGAPSLAEYDGQSLRRFIEDHLGYRFVVRRVKAAKEASAGKPFKIAFAVENTGFAAARGKIAAEIVFIQGDQVKVARAQLSVSVENWASGEVTRVLATAKTPKGLTRGPCAVALRLRVPMADEKAGDTPRRPIRFANPNLWLEAEGANRLAWIRIR